jgi:hypothetical protein
LRPQKRYILKSATFIKDKILIIKSLKALKKINQKKYQKLLWNKKKGCRFAAAKKASVLRQNVHK